MKAASVIGTALFCLAAPSAARDQINSPWLIQETAVATDIHTVRPGEFITRIPLLPLGLATVDQDVISGLNGELLLRAGVQVYRLNEGPFYIPANKFVGVVYCSVDVVREVKGLLSDPEVARVCLYDAEEDGRFDGWFWKGCGTASLPNVRGSIPKKKLPLRATSYTVVETSRLIDPPFIGIRYVRKNWDGSFRFEPAFGRRETFGYLPGVKNVGGKLPRAAELAGIGFTVLSSDDNAVKVRVDRTLPPSLTGLQGGGVC